MPKIVVYQTAPVWLVKNECFMAKIDVYRSLLASDRVIGWDIKMTSHPNSNASFINIWDRLIWRRSPNLTRSSKLAAAPNCWFLGASSSNCKLAVTVICCWQGYGFPQALFTLHTAWWICHTAPCGWYIHTLHAAEHSILISETVSSIEWYLLLL